MHVSFLLKEIMVSIFKDVNAWEIIGGEMGDFFPPEFSGLLKTFTSAPSFQVSWVEKGRNQREKSLLLPFPGCAPPDLGSAVRDPQDPARPVPWSSGERKFAQTLGSTQPWLLRRPSAGLNHGGTAPPGGHGRDCSNRRDPMPSPAVGRVGRNKDNGPTYCQPV